MKQIVFVNSYELKSYVTFLLYDFISPFTLSSVQPTLRKNLFASFFGNFLTIPGVIRHIPSVVFSAHGVIEFRYFGTMFNSFLRQGKL